MSPRTVAAILSLLVAAAAAAQPAPESPAPPANDGKIDRIATDLRTLGRIAEVAEKLENVRQVMLAIVDSDMTMLREPREDGTYRWAALQRQDASRVKDEKAVERVHSEKELREVTLTAPNAYRVEVAVPQKRSLFAANNRVFVRNVFVDSTGFDGKTTHHEIAVRRWINPGDATSIALYEIGKSVKIVAELGVESGEKRAVAEVALVQAKLVDDPASPYFPAVKRLEQIRDFAAKETIDRGYLKTAIDEALLSLPGELDKRLAEQKAAEERRRQMAMSGEAKGTIAAGDATPDVVAALSEVLRLLGGTLQDQSDARAKLQALMETLQPKPAQP